MNKWLNKVAVITGAGGGIGSACSKALLEHGMKIVGLDKSQENLEKVHNLWANDQEKQKRFVGLKCDVRQEKDVIQTFEKIAQDYGHIEVLVNNVGLARDTQLVKENNTTDLLDTIETNITGTAYCTREAFKVMTKNKNKYGHVIIMNSISCHKIPIFKGLSGNIYPPTKHALKAMAEVYRYEFSMNNRNIKVTVSISKIYTHRFY